MASEQVSRNKVALVGHCGPDSWMLRSMVSRALPGAEPLMINSDDDLEEALSQSRIVLVNRVLDGRFKTESGVELIRELTKRRDAPPVLLISNYEDSQREAEGAGAAPGFGKAELNSDKALQRLRNVYGKP